MGGTKRHKHACILGFYRVEEVEMRNSLYGMTAVLFRFVFFWKQVGTEGGLRKGVVMNIMAGTICMNGGGVQLKA